MSLCFLEYCTLAAAFRIFRMRVVKNLDLFSPWGNLNFLAKQSIVSGQDANLEKNTSKEERKNVLNFYSWQASKFADQRSLVRVRGRRPSFAPQSSACLPSLRLLPSKPPSSAPTTTVKSVGGRTLPRLGNNTNEKPHLFGGASGASKVYYWTSTIFCLSCNVSVTKPVGQSARGFLRVAEYPVGHRR